MLPAAIASGYQDPVWVPIPEINGKGQPVAELLLKPVSQGDMAAYEERFGICRRCDGANEITETVKGEDVKKPCPVCKGKAPGVGKTIFDLDVRLAIGEEMLRGGRGLLCVDQTGEVKPLEWSEKVRIGLCHTLESFILALVSAQGLGRQREAAKKGFGIPPSVDSGAGRTGEGQQG